MALNSTNDNSLLLFYGDIYNISSCWQRRTSTSTEQNSLFCVFGDNFNTCISFWCSYLKQNRFNRRSTPWSCCYPEFRWKWLQWYSCCNKHISECWTMLSLTHIDCLVCVCLGPTPNLDPYFDKLAQRSKYPLTDLPCLVFPSQQAFWNILLWLVYSNYISHLVAGPRLFWREG